jgi:outer membrane receptor protein involved in Fe transport
VLTAAQRAGDFSAFDPVTDPQTGNPFPNNDLSGRLDPVSVNIINKYMPLPNLNAAPGDDNYAGSSRGDLTSHQMILRVDQYLNAKNQIFAHYIYAHRDFPIQELNPNFKFTGNYPIHNFQVQYLHTFSPNLVNEFRTGFDLENVAQLSTRTNTDFTIDSLGIMGSKVGGAGGRPLRKDEQGFPILDISGYMGMGDDLAASNLDNSRTYQFVDNLTLVKGRHTLKLGGDVRKLLDDATTNNWPFGSLSFSGDITNDSAADFMLGIPRTVLTPEGVPINKSRQWRFAVYGQDDWKVTPRLTLNLGLRYDLFNPPKEINGVIHTLDFSSSTPVLVPGGQQVIDHLWSVSHRDFSPRIGFAYSITPETVVRGGYGIFYFGGQFDNINILQLNPPTAGSLTLINQDPANPVSTIENPYPANASPAFPFNAVTLPPDRKHPDTYVQNWNIQVSRQIAGNNVVEVGYVGSKGTHVDTSLKNFNQPDPGPGDIQSRRPFPEFARIRMQDFGVNTIYHSMQTRFEHRFSQGLSFTAAYTYSHLIDDAGETTNGGGCLCQNPRNRSVERATSLLDQRHSLVLGYVWELPFTKNFKGTAGAALGGWSLQGIVTLSSGKPFDVLESGDPQNNDGLWERPTLVPGQKLTVSNPNPSHWFNTDAFTFSNLVYGNSPRDPLVGPGTRNFDLSIGKTFKMPFNERHALQFRTEFFNAFNTPQFSNPNSSHGEGSFGTIESTKIPNREIQFGLKYSF